MAGPRKIKMFIPLNGLSKGTRKMSVETEGFSGEQRRDATKALEAALGMTREDEEMTSEFYEPEQRHEYLSEGGEGGGNS